MTMLQSAKDNPLKTLFTASGSIIAIVGAMFALDARYAHAADVAKDKAETKQIIQETAAVVRKQMLEDKLFEYDVKKEQSPTQKLTPLDAAMQQRYKRQLDELQIKKSTN
jgi:hypothetical protein